MSADRPVKPIRRIGQETVAAAVKRGELKKTVKRAAWAAVNGAQARDEIGFHPIERGWRRCRVPLTKEAQDNL